MPGRAPAGRRLSPATEIDVILATIRQLESGGRYDIGPNVATASGAYQFLTSSWAGYGGYAQAYLAPPEVQDAKAREYVEYILRHHGDDVAAIPVGWYYPLAFREPSWMDRVPSPGSGNRLTVREYQTKWLGVYEQNRVRMAPDSAGAPLTPSAVSVLTQPPWSADASAPVVVEPSWPFVVDDLTISPTTVDLAARSAPPGPLPDHGNDGMRSIAFPVLGPVAYADSWGAPRDGGKRSHEGTDIIAATMQPLLAAVDGVLVRVQHESRGISGVALSIRDDDGWRYSYFHGNDDTPGTDDGAAVDAWRIAPGLQVGDRVTAGQIIGYVGDSGNAEFSVAHLHFEIRDPSGAARPSFPSLKAAEARQACTIGIGPWSTPVRGDAAGAADQPVMSTTVRPLFGDGMWIIDSDGRVTATGDAALIMPSSRLVGCGPGPSVPFGTDAAGWTGGGPVDAAALAGTVLEGADLTGTPLEHVVVQPPAEGPDSPVWVDDPTSPPPADPIAGTMVFRDLLTGEVLFLIVPDLVAQTGDRPTVVPPCRLGAPATSAPAQPTVFGEPVEVRACPPPDPAGDHL